MFPTKGRKNEKATKKEMHSYKQHTGNHITTSEMGHCYKDTKAVTNKKYGRVFGYMQNTINAFSEAR